MKSFPILALIMMMPSRIYIEGQQQDDYGGNYDYGDYGGEGGGNGGNYGYGGNYGDGGNYYGGNYGDGGNYGYGGYGYGGNGSDYYGNYNYGNGSYNYGNYGYGNGSNNYGNYGNYGYGNGSSNYGNYGNYGYGNGSNDYGNYGYGNGSNNYYGNYGGNDYSRNNAYDDGRDAQGYFIDCGGEITELPWAIIKTPEYPSEENPQGVYPNNAYCEWWFEGNDKTLVRFKVWDIIVEIGEGGSNITCDFDYLNVTITSIGSKRFCGYTAPEAELVGMGSLTVTFVSDDTTNFRGLQATYQINEDYDPCTPSPCSINGDCEMSEDYVRVLCNCHPGFKGQRCEVDIQECASNPCRNGGTCNDRVAPNFYACSCLKGYEGINCETRKNMPCDPNPCQNGGKCKVHSESTYSCTCTDLYKGNKCEIENFPPCYSDPCQNGGACKDLKVDDGSSSGEGSSNDDTKAKRPIVYEGYECNCTSKYRGVNCEIEAGCINPGISYVDEGKKFDLDATIEFSCAEGYILFGPANITCQADGSWSDPMPDCQVNATAAAMKNKGPMTPWSGTMMALGGAFVINAVAFASWMVFKGPWKKVDRIINISKSNIKSRDEMEEELSSSYYEDDSASTCSGQSYSNSSYTSRDIP